MFISAVATWTAYATPHLNKLAIRNVSLGSNLYNKHAATQAQ